jgi:hypothetical protein
MSLTLWQPKSTSETKPLPREWIDKLFAKFMARYGQLFKDRFAGIPMDMVMDEWANELAGFTGPELQRGLDGCRALKFPPTLPEFMAMCRPPVDAHSAYVEAVRNLALRDQGRDAPWSHPAIFWAAVELGSFDMRNNSYPTIRARWERALDHYMRERDHKPIPPAMKALPPMATSGPPPEIRAKLKDLIDHMKMKKD